MKKTNHIKLFEEFMINEGKYKKLFYKIKKAVQGDVLDITEDEEGITIQILGDILGYENKEYFEIYWYPKIEEVEITVYNDNAFQDSLETLSWTEKVSSVDDLIDVINFDADGDWEKQ